MAARFHGGARIGQGSSDGAAFVAQHHRLDEPNRHSAADT
jgi:hypothetical protein